MDLSGPGIDVKLKERKKESGDSSTNIRVCAIVSTSLKLAN
jgi:hypothetical protein